MRSRTSSPATGPAAAASWSPAPGAPAAGSSAARSSASPGASARSARSSAGASAARSSPACWPASPARSSPPGGGSAGGSGGGDGDGEGGVPRGSAGVTGSTNCSPGWMRSGSPGGESRARLASTVARQYGAISASVGVRPQASVSRSSASRQKWSPGSTTTGVGLAGSWARAPCTAAARPGPGVAAGADVVPAPPAAEVRIPAITTRGASAGAATDVPVTVPPDSGAGPGSTTSHPGRIVSSGLVHIPPSGWGRARLSSQISRQRMPSPR